MTEPHLSLDALADLLTGEGEDADVAHVSSCAGCSGRLDELATAELEVAAVLASLPPPPVPYGLAARLQAAFDAEPPLVAAPAVPPARTTADGGRTGSATVTPFPQAGSRPARRWLPAAAAAALVVSGGALGAALLLGGGSTGDQTTAASSDTAGGATVDEFGDLPRNQTGTDYAAEGAPAAALPTLLGGPATRFDAQTESAPEAPVPAPALESAEQTARGTEAPLTGLSPAAGDGALGRLRTPEGLASCLSALLPPEDPSVRPLAVDYATYAGEPALAVVLPASGAADRVDVFVVGAGCTAGDDRTLFFTRLDRP